MATFHGVIFDILLHLVDIINLKTANSHPNQTGIDIEESSMRNHAFQNCNERVTSDGTSGIMVILFMSDSLKGAHHERETD